jgi:hypothetical protein
MVPAQEDQTAKMNARATEKAIHYQWRRLQLEQKYKDALLWAKDSAKACWWFYWDSNALARITTKDALGQPVTADVPEGDIGIEVGSAFELLVAIPASRASAINPRSCASSCATSKKSKPAIPTMRRSSRRTRATPICSATSARSPR